MEFDVAQWVIDFGDRPDPSDHLCHHLYYDFVIWCNKGVPYSCRPSINTSTQSTFSTPLPTHVRPYLGDIKKPRLMAIEHLRRLPRASLYISMLNTNAAWKQDYRDHES